MERMIPEKESLTVEFKSDRKKLSDDVLIDAVVAFANTEGGDIYLGVEDDGSITGMHKDHKDSTRVAAFIANRTVPPVSVRVEVVEEETANVLKISVPKSRSIVASSSGKIQRRQIKADGEPENVAMYPYEINSRLSTLSLLDYSALPVPNAKYEDLDPVEREHLRTILKNYNGEKALLELDDEDLDKALRLAVISEKKLVPTFTGMLLLGKKEKIMEHIPTAEAGYTAFRGTEVTTNESFFLPLLTAIEKIFAFLEARNAEQEMEVGLFRISIPDFDKRAMREAVVNAFAHRDYTRMGRVLIRLDDDGLSISNPGGFIEGVTVENILSVEPHGRNPALADALKRIGLAERSGRGVDRIFEGSLFYGRPLPDYSESSATSVRLFIPRGLPDKKFIRMISEEQQRIGAPMPVNTLLILNTLKQGRRMAITDIAEATKISEGKIRATVERMTEAGLIETVGAGKGRMYILSAKAYRNVVSYVRQTDIETLRYQELVLKLVEVQGTVSRKDVVELLHVSPSQAYRILQKMVKDKVLMQEGTTRTARYRKV
ncbi:RNA-binding domain-containing protein [Acutalibacter muris]|jgi:ATP-dependent DNA helicase RecG|uniref:RNA-binding domain-containing protein n=1 Tax=Acutalibacter muris TaxID=1796620 RepID=UPI0026F3E4C6|nr:RNA-binding domain-containing protein [Acutalibacter muris]